MSDSTALGDRMKRYEAVTRAVLPRRTYTVLRVDGKAFHGVTKTAERPYDEYFARCMNAVAEALCEEISGAALAYTQSDEVSVLYTDFASPGTEPWFGGVVAKQLSIAASTATAAFCRKYKVPGLFDARVLTIPDPVEVANYFLWRQRDATRNSVTMTAQSRFSHKELHGMNTDRMQEMLWSRHQINWNDMPEGFKRGRVTVKHRDREEGLPTAHWLTESAPRFAASPHTWLAEHIPYLTGLHL